MKELLVSYKNGTFQLLETPAPGVRARHVLVRTEASLVSAGTEKAMIGLAGKSLLGKARARPDLVRQVLAKVQTEGFLETWRQAQGRLDLPVPLGYSSAGVVEATGPEVEGISVGDRVACAGSGFAGHAELASVPSILCARIPQGVSSEAAAFVALGGIALEAIRMARVSLGDTVVVLGLGLLGQLAVQLLRASGCHVLGMDTSPHKAELAAGLGATACASDARRLGVLCRERTGGEGADAVIILASAAGNEPLEHAADLCRERGRVVAAGLVGLEVPRQTFYDKELALVVSRGWGPGLYDTRYTEGGRDYPYAYARWTAGRNMEAFLAQLASGAVKVDPLITHRFPFDRAIDAYHVLLEGREPSIGVVLTYPPKAGSPGSPLSGESRTIHLTRQDSGGRCSTPGSLGVGVIGAGLFARGTVLPALKTLPGVTLRGLCTVTGRTSRYMADKFGFAWCTTDVQEVLRDPAIHLVVILTRHGSHASLAAEAIRAGKHVFVEKPLALNLEQLKQVQEARQAWNGEAPPLLMVGFNRRFSPFTRWLKAGFEGVGEPLTVHCLVNAGPVSRDSWIYDPEEGGGRIIGEVCHFVDLVQDLGGSFPARVYAESLGSTGSHPSDNVQVTLKLGNGGLGSITYVSGGDKRYPRERIEVLGGGQVGVIENFASARLIVKGRTNRKRAWLGGVDRGHRGALDALVQAIRSGGVAPVPFEASWSTSVATFAIEESIRTGSPVILKEYHPGLAHHGEGDPGPQLKEGCRLRGDAE